MELERPAMLRQHPVGLCVEDLLRDQSSIVRLGQIREPERELAATYGLARNTVRRALAQLDDRLLRITGRGTYVKGLPGGSGNQFLGKLREASPAALRRWADRSRRISAISRTCPSGRSRLPR